MFTSKTDPAVWSSSLFLHLSYLLISTLLDVLPYTDNVLDLVMQTRVRNIIKIK
jgi:hypothetical protein